MSYKLNPEHATTFDDRTDHKTAREFMDALLDGGVGQGYNLYVVQGTRTKAFSSPHLHDFVLRGGVFVGNIVGKMSERGEREKLGGGRGSVSVEFDGATFAGGKFTGTWKSGVFAGNQFYGGWHGGVCLANEFNPQYCGGGVLCNTRVAKREVHATGRTVVVARDVDEFEVDPDKNVSVFRKDIHVGGGWSGQLTYKEAVADAFEFEHPITAADTALLDEFMDLANVYRHMDPFHITADQTTKLLDLGNQIRYMNSATPTLAFAKFALIFGGAK